MIADVEAYLELSTTVIFSYNILIFLKYSQDPH